MNKWLKGGKNKNKKPHPRMTEEMEMNFWWSERFFFFSLQVIEDVSEQTKIILLLKMKNKKLRY